MATDKQEMHRSFPLPLANPIQLLISKDLIDVMDDVPPVNPPEIPIWALERLANQVIRLRLEHSLYGPIDTVLHKMFPPERNFMIKPQALLRKIIEENVLSQDDVSDFGDDDTDSDFGDDDGLSEAESEQLGQLVDQDPNASIDSYASRVKGIQFIPDFIIAKAYSDIHSDKILSVLEVKKKKVGRCKATSKMVTYLHRASRNVGSVAARMLAFLVIEEDVLVYDVDMSVPIEPSLPEDREYLITDPQWLVDLHSIAVTHWNAPVLHQNNDDNNVDNNILDGI